MYIFPTFKRSLVKICGKSSTDFIASLLTRHESPDKDASSFLSALLTPQGKLLCLFILIRREEDIFIDIQERFVKTLLQNLQAYNLHSELEISVIRSHCLMLTNSTEHKLKYEERFFEKELILSFSDPTGVTQKRMWLSSELLDKAVSRITKENKYEDTNASPSSEKKNFGFFKLWNYKTEVEISLELSKESFVWHSHRIKQGFAEDEIETNSLFLAELDPLSQGVIDFAKGCFIGQEVISRMYRLGSAKRHITTFVAEELIDQKDVPLLYQGTKCIGKLISFLTKERSGFAMIRREKNIDLPIRITNQKGEKMSNLSLKKSETPS